MLFVTQEMRPYITDSDIAEIARLLPAAAQQNGMEIRVLMPRFGTINERRHRLHEVVRLSGMNIIVDDDDYPLIIKVASLPEARMQVYFLDNDDFFRRKAVFSSDSGDPFDDNADRMIFFCKGVIETVKKFGWAPDIVHCHGWMTSLIPLYLKTAYKTEPLFQNSKVIYSLYEHEEAPINTQEFMAKASINNLIEADLESFKVGEGVSLDKGAIEFADALVLGSESLGSQTAALLEDTDKPILDGKGVEDASIYLDFYQELLGEGEEVNS